MAERQAQPHRGREGAGHAELAHRAPQLLHRLRHVLEREQRHRLQARAHGEELLVDEIVVGAAERHREVGLAHPADREAGRRVEDGRLEIALVHDLEPGLGVAHVAAELAAEGAVPSVHRVVGVAAGPRTPLTRAPLEIGTQLRGRFGDVAVGVVHRERDHGCSPLRLPLDRSISHADSGRHKDVPANRSSRR